MCFYKKSHAQHPQSFNYNIYMKKSIILSSIILIAATLSLSAQKRHPKHDAYIEKYKDIAIQEQKDYGIPASITLAQGLLESAAGESRLATEGNNHFGIKCGGNWKGKRIYADDDAIGECFRSYKDPKQSYEDHSIFLRRQRYAFLFDYPITDYKSWAYGLKRAGYATDPKYPNKLIRIIELYELHQYDKTTTSVADSYKPEETDRLFEYIKIKNNNLTCIHLVENDNIRNIAREYNTSVKMLLYYNDMYKEEDLMRGDYVYLQPKRFQGERGIKSHKVKVGESMHSISQDYGIKMKSLYKINEIEYGTPVKAGQILKLRKE